MVKVFVVNTESHNSYIVNLSRVPFVNEDIILSDYGAIVTVTKVRHYADVTEAAQASVTVVNER